MYIKTIIFSFFLIACINISNAQWEWINPLPQGNDLTTIKFLNDSVGFTIGANGTFLKTNDNGNTWQISQITSGEILLSDIDIFIDGTGYIVGYTNSDYGIILKTIDFGNSWTKIKDTTNALNNSHFFNKDFGFICGENYILKTTDGGINWTTIQISDKIKCIYFLDSLNGYLGCVNGVNRRIWKTNNGGSSWTQCTTSQPIYTIQFTDQNNGYAAGYWGLILKTTDGGNTWNNIPNSDPVSFTSMHFFDSSNGYIVGLNKVFKTNNGGSSWTVIPLTGAYSVFFNDTVIGYIAGAGGYIYKTLNSGISWNETSCGYRIPLSSVYFSNELNGFATSFGSIIKTNDGGVTFSKTNLDQYSPYKDVIFVNDSVGYICGYKTGNSYGIVLKTINSGTTWDSIYSFSGQQFNSFFFTNHSTGFVVGNNGLILKTNNEGSIWNLKSYGGDPLYSVFFLNDSVGYVCGGDATNYGNEGIIRKTVNGGDNWSVVLNQATYVTFFSIFFVNENVGYAVGGTIGGGGIAKTIDGGTNWEMTYFQEYYLNSVYFLDEYRGFAVGFKTLNQQGIILITEDGGNTWNVQIDYATTILYDIYFVNDTTGFAVGENGVILRTNTAGGLVSAVKPTNNYSNIQVFPNPSNDKFYILINDNSKNVSIDLYDINGRIVFNKKYCNEKTIEIEVNKKIMNKGIYILKVVTDKNTETKKLIIQ